MMALSYMSCMHAIIVHLILTVYVTSMQGAPSMSLSMQPSRLGANAIAQVQVMMALLSYISCMQSLSIYF